MFQKFNQYPTPSKGGMIRGNQPHMPTMVRAADGEMIQSNVGATPTVYQSYHGQGRGPIGSKSPAYSFFDLMTSAEDATLRAESFEDWVFPDVTMTYREGETEGTVIPQYKIMPQKIIRRGRSHIDEDGGQTFRTVERADMEQYIYVPLNPSMNPVSTFGDANGTLIRKSDWLVCIDVGDPRGGNLSNAHIRYVINLNQPISTVIGKAMTVQDPAGGFHYLYTINEDPNMIASLTEKWFNPMMHYFNGVIYPKIRPFMDL